MTAKEYKVVALRDCPGVLPAVRTLQIETEGDRWKGALKPKIRLIGRWLERAGFRPGSRVRILCVAPGVLELRSTEPLETVEPY
jgi:hypothetical protein